MLAALRQLAQRKLQTALTVFGVAVGAAVFVMMGGVGVNAASVMNQLFDYHEDKLYVVNTEVTAMQSGSPTHPVTAEMIAQLEAVDGVQGVLPATGVGLTDEEVLQGIPFMIFGGSTGTGNKREGFWGRWEVAEGRAFEESETGVAVAGVDMLQHLGAELGDVVTVRGRDIKIVGVMKRLSWPAVDQCLMVPLADAQSMLGSALPAAFAATDAADLNLQVVIYTKPGVDTAELGRRIESQVPGAVAMDITDIRSMFEDTSWIVAAEALLVAACILALLAGAMPIVNTMSVSVADQTREIGVKRALGASAGRIVRDVLAESALIGAAGGVVGTIVAVLASAGLNSAALADSGAPVFTVSWQVVGLAMVFSIVVGVLGGVYPAWRVARLEPVDALAHE